MASEKKTRTDLETENKLLKQEIKSIRAGRIAENIASVGKSIVFWVGLVLVVRYMYLAVEAMSGKTTDADIKLLAILEYSILESDCKFFSILGFVVGLLGAVYGFFQRKLRQRNVQYRKKRYEDLEKIIDTKRSSSMLTPKGDTRPEDL